MANSVGSLELIGGPMFSGKSTEILRRLSTETEVGMSVLYINHISDNRSIGPYSTHNPFYKVTLESKDKMDYKSSEFLRDMTPFIEKYDVIGVDEAQFFDDLYDTVILWVETYHKHLIVAGLNGDFRRKRFGSILELEPFSESYTKLTSYCKLCALTKKRSLAPFTRKISGDTATTKEVGGIDKYIPVCRECYNTPLEYSVGNIV